MAFSSSNGDSGNPSAADRGSLSSWVDHCILLDGGVKADGDDIGISIGISSAKDVGSQEQGGTDDDGIQGGVNIEGEAKCSYGDGNISKFSGDSGTAIPCSGDGNCTEKNPHNVDSLATSHNSQNLLPSHTNDDASGNGLNSDYIGSTGAGNLFDGMNVGVHTGPPIHTQNQNHNKNSPRDTKLGDPLSNQGSQRNRGGDQFDVDQNTSLDDSSSNAPGLGSDNSAKARGLIDHIPQPIKSILGLDNGDDRNSGGNSGGSSTTGHHHDQGSGDKTSSGGTRPSNTSPPSPQQGGGKSNNPEPGSSPGNGGDGDSGPHNAGSSGGAAGQTGKGSQNGPGDDGGNNNEGGGGGSPRSSGSPSQTIPPISRTQPSASTSTADVGSPVNTGDSSQSETSILTSPQSSNSATEAADSMDTGSSASVVGVSSASVFTSTVTKTYAGSISGSPTTVSVFTTTGIATMISPSETRNSINMPTSSRPLIGGIIGGIIAFLALSALLLFLFIRKRRRLRIASSLFNFDTENFVGVKRSAESTLEASVSTPATHMGSPTVDRRKSTFGWEDDKFHDHEVSEPRQTSRDNTENPFRDASPVAHARMSIISNPFADPVPVVEDPFRDPARRSKLTLRDSETGSLVSFEESTVQKASRVPIVSPRRL
ncbi:uncharacterized protein EV420DRAFT_1475024 [Desarmillaria tabescens]|uniref:Uncharacterized protein n=1 Tax=Armillaria tabescens TaxID=1929756 RepID=A0AA39NII5_ARMTA|nr:uncharacterized protein EV420DRAFT_1475024 [Desarmillaria tabescens]KAK0466262.1 hypothetical protein EV420DRAFT_1475024 [Desarmillaria tabescens]